MKYKTIREVYRCMSTVFFVYLLIFIISEAAFMKDNNYPGLSVFGIFLGLFLSMLFFIYCWTANVKRKKFIKYGVRFRGRIVSAEVRFRGRGENIYYLFIEFYDHGKKTRFTEGYVGHPCNKLRNLQCDIYKLDNQYIEANFSVLGKKESPGNQYIPTKRYKLFARHKGYV